MRGPSENVYNMFGGNATSQKAKLCLLCSTMPTFCFPWKSSPRLHDSRPIQRWRCHVPSTVSRLRRQLASSWRWRGRWQRWHDTVRTWSGLRQRLGGFVLTPRRCHGWPGSWRSAHRWCLCCRLHYGRSGTGGCCTASPCPRAGEGRNALLILD